MSRLAVVGGGSWGTALSIALAPRFEQVGLWVYEPDLAERMQTTRENDAFLKGFRLPENIQVSHDPSALVPGAEVVIAVTPSQHLRRVITSLAPVVDPGATVISATKGIETPSLLRMSEVIRECLPRVDGRIAVLSGPTFAREIAAGEPAAVVISSANQPRARDLQVRLSGPVFRLYTNSDPIGVEIGAALKNVIAIAAGICKGLGLGNNTLAALVTRGLAEISRLAIAMGGDGKTLAGLAGLGDLVLTCNGDLSRNRSVGVELGRGRSLDDILGSTRMVAEGVHTTFAAVELAGKFKVEMPIVDQMYEVLQLGKPPRDAIRDLMERTLKPE